MLAPISIEQFQECFFQHGRAYWKAYSGKSCVGRYEHDTDFEGDEMVEFSWMQFENFVRQYPSGKIQVELRKNPNDSKDRAIKKDVSWGDYTIGATNPRQPAMAMPGGNMWPMFQMMLQNQQQNFAAQLQSNNEIQRLRFENSQLVDMVEAANQPPAQIEMVKEIAGIARDFLKPKANFQPQKAALGTLGQKGAGEQVKEQAVQAKQGVSLDKIMVYVRAIATALPEYNVEQVIYALAIYVQQNTEQAKAFLGPMIQQLNNAKGKG